MISKGKNWMVVGGSKKRGGVERKRMRLRSVNDFGVLTVLIGKRGVNGLLVMGCGGEARG